ncbi:hypothetical protein PMAYCL1PPCAC_16172, partial [Pristionchus mayeri]
ILPPAESPIMTILFGSIPYISGPFAITKSRIFSQSSRPPGKTVSGTRLYSTETNRRVLICLAIAVVNDSYLLMSPMANPPPWKKTIAPSDSAIDCFRGWYTSACSINSHTFLRSVTAVGALKVRLY